MELVSGLSLSDYQCASEAYLCRSFNYIDNFLSIMSQNREVLLGFLVPILLMIYS